MGSRPVVDRAVDGRAAWITAIAATAILSVSFGAPQLLVVALVPIAEDLGAVRAVPRSPPRRPISAPGWAASAWAGSPGAARPGSPACSAEQ
ncbi:hypothetical protein [Dankookia sp. P2]|uniref:hypothetical protein n=1 Tax=Dankookia sp. P2 TaxID=3423955 RepID=UPI003D6729F5